MSRATHLLPRPPRPRSTSSSQTTKTSSTLLRETLATRQPSESVLAAVRRASLAWLDRVTADPSLFLVRSRLAAGVPAAHAHSRHLDAEYENLIADAVVATRDTDPTTDLEVLAPAPATAAWAATRAARDIWLVTEEYLTRAR